MQHHLPMNQMLEKKMTDGSYRLQATKKNFPALNGMSFYKIHLAPKAFREPHWHANAHELGYCTKGEVLISLYKTGNIKDKFLVKEGKAFFIPSGSLHSVENASKTASEVILQFSNEEPEDFSLSTAFGMFTNSVLGNTWGVKSSDFNGIKRSGEVFIGTRKDYPAVTENTLYDSPFRFDLANQNPFVYNEGGNVRVARQNTWPILSTQALYSLHLTDAGMREPHWHPQTAEMGYVNYGHARMSVLSPNGNIDTYEVKAGDLYFIPKAYPHHIENLGKSDLNILIFFDQPMPEDIGFTASLKSFDNEVLTALFDCKDDFFKNLPTYYHNLLIVKRSNPV